MMTRKQRQAERGQSIVEYALILSLVGVVSLGAVAVMGEGLERTYDKATCTMEHESNGNMYMKGECIDAGPESPPGAGAESGPEGETESTGGETESTTGGETESTTGGETESTTGGETGSTTGGETGAGPETTAEPEPVVTAEPEPVVTAEPEPIVTAEPEPIVTAEPEPVVTAEPEPIVTAEPEPVVTAEPEPIVDPDTCPEINVQLVRFECRPNTSFRLQVQVSNCPGASVTVSGGGFSNTLQTVNNTSYSHRRHWGKNDTNSDAICDQGGALYDENNFTLDVSADGHNSTYSATINRR